VGTHQTGGKIDRQEKIRAERDPIAGRLPSIRLLQFNFLLLFREKEGFFL
jgi:hypothetical protein